jgi:hypothetical protein
LTLVSCSLFTGHPVRIRSSPGPGPMGNLLVTANVDSPERKGANSAPPYRLWPFHASMSSGAQRGSLTRDTSTPGPRWNNEMHHAGMPLARSGKQNAVVNIRKSSMDTRPDVGLHVVAASVHHYSPKAHAAMHPVSWSARVSRAICGRVGGTSAAQTGNREDNGANAEEQACTTEM